MVSDYNYLDVLNGVLGKVYHSTEDAKKDLANLFRFLRISMAAIEKSGAKWYPALRILRNVSINGTSQMTAEERAADVAILAQYMICKEVGETLGDYLNNKVFATSNVKSVNPATEDVEGFKKYIETYCKLLPAENLAADVLG